MKTIYNLFLKRFFFHLQKQKNKNNRLKINKEVGYNNQ